MKFCQKCGRQIDANAQICPNCGQPQGQGGQQQQQFQQPGMQQPGFQQPGFQQGYGGPKNPGTGLGIASMVVGILSLILAFFLPVVPIILAIVGVALGAVGMKKSKEVGMPAGMAIAGLVTSIVTLGLSIICTICICSAASALTDAFGSLDDFY